jgi:hypothetical protein
MAQLTNTFRLAVKAFNDAQTQTNYNAVKQFLDSNVVMQRVDDPTAVQGVPGVIINYLNSTQIGQWPTLDLGSYPVTEKVVKAIGNVHGDAMYTDKIGTKPYLVRYCFRFRMNSNGEWLIAIAFAAPI